MPMTPEQKATFTQQLIEAVTADIDPANPDAGFSNEQALAAMPKFADWMYRAVVELERPHYLEGDYEVDFVHSILVDLAPEVQDRLMSMLYRGMRHARHTFSIYQHVLLEDGDADADQPIAVPESHDGM